MSARPTAAAIRAGISRLREHTYMVDRAGDPYILGFDAKLEATGRVPRLLALAYAAIGDALSSIQQPLPRVPAFVAVSEVATTEADAFGRFVSERLTEMLAPLEVDVVVIAKGNAGGFSALQLGVEHLVAGRQPLCLVVGADSFVDADLLDTLDGDSRLGCTRHRWGFPPGEAGAAIVLASTELQETHGLRSMGEIVSLAVGYEPNHARAETPCTGKGLGSVLTKVLDTSVLQEVSLTLCDLDGERFRDREYTWASQRVPSQLPFAATRYESLVPSCGTVGGATAILGLVTAACWGERGHHSNSDILVWAGSDLGLRGAALLRTASSASGSRT